MATPPQQARSIATEQKMLDAAEELIKGGDARQVTLENVVKLSGATVGSFYARFGSVEGLFMALEKRHRHTLNETMFSKGFEKALQQTDLRSAVHQLFKPALEFARRENKTISFMLFSAAQGRRVVIEDRKNLVEILRRVLLQHRDEIPHKDLRRASENVFRMVYAMWIHVGLQEPSLLVGRKTSLSSVIELTTDMAYAYLTTE